MDLFFPVFWWHGERYDAGEDPAKGVSNWGSLQVLPDALAGRVMIWRGLFATG